MKNIKDNDDPVTRAQIEAGRKQREWDGMIDRTVNEVKSTIDDLQPASHKTDSSADKPKVKPTVNVQLVRIDLPFWNMVNFMVTAAIAAIPAIIILFLLGVALMAVVGGIGGMGR